jgi:choline kinase
MNIFNIKQHDHIRSRVQKYSLQLAFFLAHRYTTEYYDELHSNFTNDEKLGAKKALELLETVWTFPEMRAHLVYEIDIFKKAVEEFRESLITNSENY